MASVGELYGNAEIHVSRKVYEALEKMAQAFGETVDEVAEYLLKLEIEAQANDEFNLYSEGYLKELTETVKKLLEFDEEHKSAGVPDVCLECDHGPTMEDEPDAWADYREKHGRFPR